MAHLYGAVRQYLNYFQPSFKLVEQTRHGSRLDFAHFQAAQAMESMSE